MKRIIGTSRPVILVLLIVSNLTLSIGCGSVQEHRSRQRATTFSRLPAEARERILRGEIHRGDSPEASYIALGTPQYTISDAGGAWVWVYWGVVANRSNVQPDSSRVPDFHTRAELRLPRVGDKRKELRLFFREGKLERWQLGEIEMKAAAGQSILPLGTVPERLP